MKKLKISTIKTAIRHLNNEPIEKQGLSQLLLKLKLTYADWLSLSDSDDPETMVAVRVMSMYKEWWEGEIEKLLITQNKKFYNYNLLKWLLEKSNPLKYSNKKPIENKVAGFSMDELKNESDFDFFEATSKDN